jgi:hypothetical protein
LTAVCEITPDDESQLSLVQALLSSTETGVCEIFPFDVSQLSIVHASPSVTLMGVCETPVIVSQASAVQGLLSSIVTEVPPVQFPLWQVSDCVQAFPSLHAAPSAFAGVLQTPVPVSQTPTS